MGGRMQHDEGNNEGVGCSMMGQRWGAGCSMMGPAMGGRMQHYGGRMQHDGGSDGGQDVE